MLAHLTQDLRPAAAACPSKFAQKRPALVNQKSVVLRHDNARPHTARVRQDNFWSLDGLFYPIHHIHLTLRLLIIIFFGHFKIL